MNLRSHRLLKQVGGSAKPDFAASYTVTVYPVGAVSSHAPDGETLYVDAGHSFIAGDKLLIDPGGANHFSGSSVVASTTATTITMGGGNYAAAVAGARIANLGTDTGVASPNYDGSPCVIYSDADGGSAITNSRVTANSLGEYSYYHRGDGKFWEIIRNADGRVTDVIVGASIVSRANTVDYGDLGDGSVTDSVDAALLALASGEEMLFYGKSTPVTTFSDGDATPSVLGRRFFKTANTTATIITDFDDGIVGQEIFVLIDDENTTVDFTSTNLKGNAGVNWSPTSDSTLSGVYDGTYWYCDVVDSVISEDDIVTLAPTAWWAADDSQDGAANPTNGQEMRTNFTSWKDKVGSRDQPAAATVAVGSRPAWYDTAGASPAPPSLPNGMPCFSFVSRTCGDGAESSFTFITLADFTIYGVVYQGATSGPLVGENLFDSAADVAARWVVQGFGGGAGAVSVFETSQPLGAGNLCTITYETGNDFLSAAWRRVMFHRTGTTVVHKVRDTVIDAASTSGPQDDGCAIWQLMRRTEVLGGNTELYNTWVAEIIVWNRALSADEQATVEAYLDAKYGLGA